MSALVKDGVNFSVAQVRRPSGRPHGILNLASVILYGKSKDLENKFEGDFEKISNQEIEVERKVDAPNCGDFFQKLGVHF